MSGTAGLFATLPDLSRALRRGKLSPVGLAEECLTAARTLDPALRAFVTIAADRALAEARQAEQELANGLDRGPLHGVPYAVKDLFAVPGIPWSCGSPLYRDRAAPYEATVVRKLREAGAVLIGTTAMTELAGGPPGASLTGACRTPWDTARWSGGSSAGSGAAVAAGIVPFALGTETWGSIMTPASFCGVTGLRPSFGRVSRAGVMTLSWSLDKVGVLARSARDCALVLGAVAGPDPEDPAASGGPLKISFTRSLERVRALRVGFLREDYDRWGHPEAGAAFAQARATLAAGGVPSTEVGLPAYPYEEVAETILAAEQSAAFAPLVRAGRIGGVIDPQRRGEILGGYAIGAAEYLRAQRVRTLMGRAMASLFERVDILLGSSTLSPAPPVDAPLAAVFPGGNAAEAAENLLGLPAVSVPCGFTRTGLPLGMKIIAPPGGDADVLHFAHVYQSMTSWHQRRPPVP